MALALVNSLWDDLASEDAAKAYQAIGKLVAAPDPSELDHFENALQSARIELKAAVDALVEKY